MSEWFYSDIIVQKGMNSMVEIVKKGDKSNAIKKFKCKDCKTVFLTREEAEKALAERN